MSFGGPERPEEVMPFLGNVTRGRGIPAERLADVGLYADPTTPEGYLDLIRTDIARLGKLVKDANIKRE